jgi:hypothetical protein
MGGWVGPRVGLNDVENRKFLTLPRLELRTLCRGNSSQAGEKFEAKENLHIANETRSITNGRADLNCIEKLSSYLTESTTCPLQRSAG